MAQKIDTKPTNIQNLFSNSNSQESVLEKDGIFTIPEYQRAYSYLTFYKLYDVIYTSKKMRGIYYGCSVITRQA